MRIGVNLRMFEEIPSGIQNYIYGLFRTLLEKDKTHQYFFFSTGEKKIEKAANYIKADFWFIKILSRLDIRLVNIFFDNLYVVKLIKDFGVKIFISPSSILPLFKPVGVKYLVVIHDLSFLKYAHNPLKIYMNLVMYMKILMPLVIKRADVIIVDSIFVKKELEKIYKAEPGKIEVIYPGVDIFFRPIKNEKAFLELTKKYKIEKKYLFTTATNHERKNIFGLIAAFKEIKSFDEYQLIICGLLPGFTVIKLQKYLQELNLTKKVKFLGFVSKEELRLLYSYARIFVFPSFEEGFGLPVLEAAACGCLPICSDAGALPEVIGDKKLLFDPKNFESMSEKINEALLWPEEKSAQHLQKVKRHISKFSWTKAAQQYLKLLK